MTKPNHICNFDAFNDNEGKKAKMVYCVLTCRSCGTVMSASQPVEDTPEEREKIMRDAPKHAYADSVPLQNGFSFVVRDACDAKTHCADRMAGYDFTWKPAEEQIC